MIHQDAATAYAASAGSFEPFGGVSVRKRNNPSSVPPPPFFTNPQTTTTPTGSSSSHYYPPTTAQHHHTPSPPPTYLHNYPISLTLLPPLLLFLSLHPSPLPKICMIVSLLITYGFDLANSRDGVLLSVGLGFIVTSCSLLFGMGGGGEEEGGVEWRFLTVLMVMGVGVLLLFCLACWSILQFPPLHHDHPEFTLVTERILLSLLPPVSSSLSTYVILNILISHSHDTETASTLSPHIFALLLSLSLSLLSPLPRPTAPSPSEKERNNQENYILHPHNGYQFSLLLLLTPPLIHIGAMRRRFSALDGDDVYDLILAVTVPIILHYILVQKKVTWWLGIPRAFRSGSVLPPIVKKMNEDVVVVSSVILGSLAFQQRYMVSWCRNATLSFGSALEMSEPSSLLISLYLTFSLAFLLMAGWILRKQRKEGEREVLGEYTEDLFQGCVSMGGFFFSLSLGAPLRLSPMFVLVVLSLALFVTSKLLRYMLVFLTVTCITLTAIVAYRVSFLSITLKNNISLFKFALAIICSIFLLGTAVGVVYRAPGGMGSRMQKSVAGALLSGYALLVGVFEVVLMTEPPLVDDGIIYHPYPDYLPLVTSLLSLTVALYWRSIAGITTGSAVLVSSVTVGKLTTLYFGYGDDLGGMTYRFTVTVVLLITLSAPYVYMTPVDIKSLSRLQTTDGSLSALLKPFKIRILTYIYVILPLSLVTSSRIILQQVMEFLSWSLTPMELFGYVLSLWGLAATLALSHLLPENCGADQKKTAVIIFIVGGVLALSAPTIPDISSGLFSNVSSGTSGWGLLLCGLACVLALTGPLDLAERKGVKKDETLLLRLMVFSLLFSLGSSWFVTIQSMAGEAMVPIFLTTVACLMSSFFGTVATVLGYFLELKDFEEVVHVVRLWLAFLPVFFLVAAASVVVGGESHALGVGGWCSTYVGMCAVNMFGFGMGLRMRGVKAVVTRSMANLFFVGSWGVGIVLVYGHFGLAGVGVKGCTTVFGIHASIVGTCFLSLILLGLEGEPTEKTRSHRISSKSTPIPLGFKLTSLNPHNRFAPSLFATTAIFFIVSFYVIFIRGSGMFELFSSNTVHKNYEDVFASVYGTTTRTTDITSESATDALASMARKTLVHNNAVIIAARLAGSGLWTSRKFFGPFLHMMGMVCVFPSWMSMICFFWDVGRSSGKQQQQQQRRRQKLFSVLLFLPWNFITLFLCQGIPCLKVLALIVIVGSIVQVVLMRRDRRRQRISL